MTGPDYQAWLDHLFGHLDDEPEWYFAAGFEAVPIGPQTLTAHVLRLLKAPALLMTDYSDQQIASGLKYLIDNACGGDIRLVSRVSVPQSDRLELAARIDRVHSQIFAARCAPALGSLSEGAEQPLNMLCYMWWDTIVFDTTGEARLDREFFAALIEAMGRTLAIPHPACQEAALHGLGHWGEHAPARAAALIDAYLAGNRAARPELVSYARAASAGCIQ
ncbi:MAG: hypothetical protein ACTSVG_15030 [Alphaproteobacteria bacterium]